MSNAAAPATIALSTQLCPECDEPLYTVTGPEGTERFCNNRHRYTLDPTHQMPVELRRIAKSLGYIGEMPDDEGERLGLQATIIGEQDEAKLDALVPIAEGVDIEGLMDGDDVYPRQVVVEVIAGTSRNNRIWKREALAAIAAEVNNGGLPGYKGHLKPEDVGSKFVDPATHWIGAREAEPGRFLFRGVIDKVQGELKRWIRTKRITTVSIFGLAKSASRRGKYAVIESFEPHSIDWTPLKRSGMPAGIVAMEMDEITEPGKTEVPNDKTGLEPGKGGKMDLAEIIGELRKEGVKPDALIGELNWNPEDVVKATGLSLDKVGPALARDEWTALQAAHKTFGEMEEVLGTKDPDKILESIKEGQKALDAQRTAGHDKIVTECIEAKVSGELAQSTVRDMLRVEDNASKEDIEKAVGEVLERPNVKMLLKNAKVGSNGPATTGSTNDRKSTDAPSGARRRKQTI